MVLGKNAESNIEQVLKTKPHKTAVVRPPTTRHESNQNRRSRHHGHCWWSMDGLVSYVLLWIPSHGRAKVGCPARTYIQQLCADTGCSPEDLLKVMDDKERWRERVSSICAGSTT